MLGFGAIYYLMYIDALSSKYGFIFLYLEGGKGGN